MPSNEFEQILKRVLPIETANLDPPSMNDWQRLESTFCCTFGSDFKVFIDLMSRYRFPGEILNVSTGRTNGDDSIEVAYNLEREYEGWNSEMIPYYAIGNGDYFCLYRSECPDSSVYYYYLERREFVKYCSTFIDWVRQLPGFLGIRQ